MANLLVEVSGICNLRCPMCAYSSLTRPKGFMKLDLWRKIIDDCQLHGHKIEWIHSMGEPLLWPNLIEGIRYLTSKGLTTQISTNGLLLDSTIVNDLYEAGQRSIMVTLDTMLPEVYAKIRGSGYSIVVDNIKQAIAMKKLRIIVQFMPSTLNQQESRQDFYNFFGPESQYLYVIKWFTIRMVGSSLNISWQSHQPDQIDKAQCFITNQYCHVLWDGRTSLCCADVNGELITGDLYSSTVEECYNGPKARKLRELIQIRQLPDTCKRCFADHMNMGGVL